METIHVSQAGEDGQELDAGSPTIVQVQIPNQPVQVQSVIHSQPSVIQTAGGHIQAIQVVAPVTEGDTDEEGDGSAKKRRDILARRPSYRWVLNELTGEPGAVTIGKVEDDSDESEDSRETNGAVANLRSMVPAQTIQIAAHGDGTTQGLQTLTMSNATASQANTGATIVQYAQGPDGQFFIPAGQVQAYQISAPQASLPQGVVMATSPALTSPQQITEEASRKRELRLLKNSEAARECRRKKKDYVKCLENRVAVLENQNRALIEELKSLKELYCQKQEG